MITVNRHEKPVLVPDKKNSWESEAVFNGSIVKMAKGYLLLYRAMSTKEDFNGTFLSVSRIGKAESSDGYNFVNRQPFIVPEYEWEKYGCEDPRIVFIDGKYVIFYTALATYPPTAPGIRVGVAISRDLEKIEEKHLVTPFNAKAMVMFPEKINGKFAGLLTVDTDNPPSKISYVEFEKLSDLWDKSFWLKWYSDLARYTLPLIRRSPDHVEIGLVPIRSSKGWVLIYSYIQNYLSDNKIFGIEAVLLSLNNPLKIMNRTTGPFMIPESYPELYGAIPNIIFPSGGLVEESKVRLYYGASDTSVCTAEFPLKELIDTMINREVQIPIVSVHSNIHLTRFEGNPIISPLDKHHWEKKAVLNAAAIEHNQTIYILYRAMDDLYVSTIGLATTRDGFHIDKRWASPVYAPREEFEMNAEGGSAGCEDARLTQIGNMLYMQYTGFDGKVPRVVHTSISLSDFVSHKWNWSKPRVISTPLEMDKNSAVFPQKIGGKFIILHRLGVNIWIDKAESFEEFGEEGRWLKGEILAVPRPGNWDSIKIGIAGPPIETELGWLLVYHGISDKDLKYRLGLMLLDLKDPTTVLLRLDNFILEPKLAYENQGVRPGAVFSCGGAILNDHLFVYYGAGDSTLCVAQIRFSDLLSHLKSRLP